MIRISGAVTTALTSSLNVATAAMGICRVGRTGVPGIASSLGITTEEIIGDYQVIEATRDSYWARDQDRGRRRRGDRKSTPIMPSSPTTPNTRSLHDPLICCIEERLI